MARNEFTPERITELQGDEVFVFGSNLQGHHYGGAARAAMERFGAVFGVGVGPQGRSYAIPTMQGGVDTIKPYVDQFLAYARDNKESRFLVTRIGCGIAGFKDTEIAPLFREAWDMENVLLPESFCRLYEGEADRAGSYKYRLTGLKMESLRVRSPDAFVKVTVELDGHIEVRDILMADNGSPAINFLKANSNVLDRAEIPEALDCCDQPVYKLMYDRYWAGKVDPPARGFDPVHEARIRTLEDTLEMIRSTPALVEACSRSRTKPYFAGPFRTDALPERPQSSTRVRVTGHRTFEAARLLSREFPGKKIAVLNFASATRPGGGVLWGSSAQEEGLCRCSTLYDALDNTYCWENYYHAHIDRRDPLFTDACLYSTDIYVIKTDTAQPERLPESEWTKVDVITCAAPNLSRRVRNCPRPANITPEELLQLHLERGRKIMNVACYNKVDVLVLGAFGCGAFRNDPKVVAEAYRCLVQEFDGKFDAIEFAVFCKPGETANYDTFAQVIGG